MNRLKNKTCFLFDLDGTIYLSEHLIPGATDLLAEIRRQGKHFAFMTNNSSSAKQSFEQEIKIAELKDEAAKYKESLTKTGENIRKKLTFEELDEIKKNISSSAQKLNESFNDIKSEISENTKVAK